MEKGLGAPHHLIPPGAKTYQINVESFHRWVEEELYAAEPFGSEKDELAHWARVDPGGTMCLHVPIVFASSFSELDRIPLICYISVVF